MSDEVPRSSLRKEYKLEVLIKRVVLSGPAPNMTVCCNDRERKFGIDFSQDSDTFLTSKVLKFSNAFEALKHQFKLPSEASQASYLFGCEFDGVRYW